MSISPTCHVIGVLGGKGGVGKSVFAANIALAIQMELRTSTLLIDLDSKSCGDQNIITGLRPVKTMEELCRHTGSISSASLNTLLARHASGMMYVGAVHNAGDPHDVDPEAALKQLDALSKHFKYIVIDLGCDLNPLQLAVASECTALTIVTIPEVLAITQTNRLLNELMSATLPNEMMQIVVNKASRSGLAPASIGQTLRKQVVGVIPQDDITVNGSVQRSAPFILNSKTPIAAAYHETVRRLCGGLLQKLKSLNKPKGIQLKAQEQHKSNKPKDDSNSPTKKKEQDLDPRTILKLRIHHELIEAMDLKKGIADTDGDPAKERALEQKTQQSISQILDKASPGLARDERSSIIKEVLDEALKLGPLEDLLEDMDVTEIMVNGWDKIFIERKGRITLSPVVFTSNLQLRNVIERIVTPLGRRIDEKTPYVDARLLDGSRVHAIIEPLAIDGPALTIRKFAKDPITAEHYVNWGTATRSMLDFLKICVEQGLNVVISGGTGSGKTTLLNVMSSCIPNTERVITVEDAAELQLKQEHVVRLETRPANMEGTGAISIRDLIKNTLRMRPDRIVVGECRDGAALDMLQAMNTGHDGSMTTVHANNPREAIGRLETLCMMAGMELPVQAIREQIAGAVDLIIQISRLSDGSRKIISVTEVVGIQGETVTLQEVFRFREDGYDKNRKIIGTFQAMGLIPSFIEKFEARGVIIPRHLFSNGPENEHKPAPPPKKGLGIKKPAFGGLKKTKKVSGGN